MYENGEKKSCYSQGERLMKEYDRFLKQNIEGSGLWRKTFLFYFNEIGRAHV